MLRSEYVSAGPDLVLVRVSTGRRSRPSSVELVVVGGDGSVVDRVAPLPDPPGAGGGGGWRGGFPVPVGLAAWTRGSSCWPTVSRSRWERRCRRRWQRWNARSTRPARTRRATSSSSTANAGARGTRSVSLRSEVSALRTEVAKRSRELSDALASLRESENEGAAASSAVETLTERLSRAEEDAARAHALAAQRATAAVAAAAEHARALEALESSRAATAGRGGRARGGPDRPGGGAASGARGAPG